MSIISLKRANASSGTIVLTSSYHTISEGLHYMLLLILSQVALFSVSLHPCAVDYTDRNAVHAMRNPPAGALPLPVSSSNAAK